LYEIRVEVGSDIYRAFTFFDKGQLIILVNGFQKKSQKTPKSEIELAEKLRKQYFDEKDK
jgi:phage-related protein